MPWLVVDLALVALALLALAALAVSVTRRLADLRREVTRTAARVDPPAAALRSALSRQGDARSFSR